MSNFNKSEHFLGSNKAFEILANLGVDPLVGVGREAKLWFDVDSGGGKDEACGGESRGEGASKTITDKVVGANFADADAFKNMVTKWIKWGAARAQRCRIGGEEGKAEFSFNCCRKFPIGQTV